MKKCSLLIALKHRKPQQDPLQRKRLLRAQGPACGQRAEPTVKTRSTPRGPELTRASLSFRAVLFRSVRMWGVGGRLVPDPRVARPSCTLWSQEKVMRMVMGSCPQSLVASQGHSRQADLRCWPVCCHATGCPVRQSTTDHRCLCPEPACLSARVPRLRGKGRAEPTLLVPQAAQAAGQAARPRLRTRVSSLAWRVCAHSRKTGSRVPFGDFPTHHRVRPAGSRSLLRREPTALVLPMSGSPARAWLLGRLTASPHSRTCRPNRHFLAWRPALGSP